MDAALPPSPPVDAAGASSLTDRLVNVVTNPGEVFAEIQNKPVGNANWLVPLALSCLATAIYICIAFSQPAIMGGIETQREKAMQKQVAAGKLTQAQADQATALVARFMTPVMLKIVSAGGAALAGVSGLFLMSLGIWLCLKYLIHVELDFLKVVEVCGLGLVIDVLQKIIRTWLVVWKDNLLATASPTLFLADANPANKVHVFLSILDVVDFWWLAVLSLGLSKVATIRYRTAAFLVFGIWFGFRIVLALLTPSPT